MMIAITRWMLASTDQGKMDIQRKGSGGDFTEMDRTGNGIMLSKHGCEAVSWHAWVCQDAVFKILQVSVPNLGSTQSIPKEVLYDLGLGLAGTPVNILEIKGIKNVIYLKTGV